MILVTGFERFGGLDFNPTELGVRELKRQTLDRALPEICAEVLPVEFLSSGRRIIELVNLIKPTALICFGVAISSHKFLLERVALNLDDSAQPDNAGFAPIDSPIIESGPVAYRSTLPLKNIHKQLVSARIPVNFSNHAGTYVCNHVFYLACHEIAVRGLSTQCGFVHVPFQLQLSSNHAYPSATLAVMQGMKECVIATHNALATDLSADTKCTP